MSGRMSNRIPLAIGLCSGVLLILGLVGAWPAFGLVTWLLLFLCAAIGFGTGRGWRGIAKALALLMMTGALLKAAILYFDTPAGEPFLVLGMPLATAFLTLGIWPLGIALGILYYKVFDRSILPPAKLNEFLQKYCRRDSAR